MKRSEALLLARKYKNALQEAGIPITSVIVFGSAARDAMHEQSDIDIAVVGTSFKKNRMEESREVWRARRPISYRIQPIWFYPEHLEDKYSTLAQEIEKDGVSV